MRRAGIIRSFLIWSYLGLAVVGTFGDPTAVRMAAGVVFALWLAQLFVELYLRRSAPFRSWRIEMTGTPAVKALGFGGAVVGMVWAAVMAWVIDDLRVVRWLLLGGAAWTGVFAVVYFSRAVTYYRRGGSGDGA